MSKAEQEVSAFILNTTYHTVVLSTSSSCYVQLYYSPVSTVVYCTRMYCIDLLYFYLLRMISATAKRLLQDLTRGDGVIPYSKVLLRTPEYSTVLNLCHTGNGDTILYSMYTHLEYI